MTKTPATQAKPAWALPPLLGAKTRPLLTWVVVLGVLQACFSIALTLGLATVFPLVTAPNSSVNWGLVLGGAAVLATLGFALRSAERWLAEKFGQEYVHAVRIKLWRKLETLPASSVAGERKGATVLRFIGDLSSLKNWVSRGLIGLVVSCLSIVGGVIALFWLDVRLGGIATLVLTSTLLLQAYWNQKVLSKVRTLRKSRSRLATDIVERIQSLAVVQGANQTLRERRRIQKKSRGVVDSATSTAMATGVLLGFAEFASLGLLAAVLLAGAVRLQQGALQAGDLVAAMVLSRYLATPLRRLGHVQEQWAKGRVSQRKLEKFLNLESLAQPLRPVKLKPGNGRVTIQKVLLDTVVRPVSASAKVGDRVYLEGANGIGKSRLLQLIAGLEPLPAGKIALDGRDLSRCSPNTIRSAISLVSPALPLMRGSLRRNLKYGAPKAGDREIEEILNRVGLSPMVDRLDRGLSTWITDGGSNLSQGEAARVRLARALLAKPRVLLLDDADQGLDANGRRTLTEIVQQFEGTVIFVWRGQTPPAHTVHWKLTSKRLRSTRIVSTKPSPLAAVSAAKSSVTAAGNQVATVSPIDQHRRLQVSKTRDHR